MIGRLTPHVKLVFFAGFITIFFIGIFAFRSANGKHETIVASNQTIAQEVLVSGQIRAQGLASIYPSTTGIVTDIFVSEGDSVSEGQDLFSVKSTATEQEKQAAYAAYLAAQTTVDDARSTADTLRSDMYNAWKEYYDLATNDTYEEEDGTPKELERGAVEFQTSKYDWLAAEQKYTNQQEKIGAAAQQAQALYQIYQATQDSTTTAPSSGVIANIAPAVGDLVTALPSLSATPVLSLSNFDSYFVEVEIKETDVPLLSPGQRATIAIDALPEETISGTISTIDLLGQNTAGVITYTTRIGIDNPPASLRHMMSATARIKITEKENVLAIPPAALQDRNGEKGVMVVQNNKQIWRPVIVGIRGSSWIEIVDGIARGEEIVVPTLAY